MGNYLDNFHYALYWLYARRSMFPGFDFELIASEALDKAIETYKDGDLPFKSWLRICLKSKLRDYRNRQHISIEDSQEQIYYENFDDEFCSKMLSIVPKEHRLYFHLLMDGHSISGIARMCNTPRATVTLRIKRYRKILKEALCSQKKE